MQTKTVYPIIPLKEDPVPSRCYIIISLIQSMNLYSLAAKFWCIVYKLKSAKKNEFLAVYDFALGYNVTHIRSNRQSQTIITAMS